VNLDKWARLDKMASRAPANLSGDQWSELIEFARDQIGQDATQDSYWQRKQSEYESSKAQEDKRTGQAGQRLAEQLENPAPEIDPVKVVREKLMADFKIERMDKKTVMLVEMLIKQISPKAFEAVKTPQEIKDHRLISYMRDLVEHYSLGDAYIKTDDDLGLSEGYTAKRFSRLAKEEFPAVGFREMAGDIKGKVVVTKEESGVPKYPEVNAILDKHSQRRAKLTKKKEVK
jgi:hypothetical protein